MRRLDRLLVPLGAIVHLSMADADACAEAADIEQARLLIIYSLFFGRRPAPVCIQPWRSAIIADCDNYLCPRTSTGWTPK